MNTIENWRRFIKAYPKHRIQQGGLPAYDLALTKVTASELQFAVRRFAAEVRAAHPNGPAWRYCPGPARWLSEELWRAYLPGTPSMPKTTAKASPNQQEEAK